MFILERSPYFLFLLWTLSCLQLQPRALDPRLSITELTLSPTSPSSLSLPIPIDSSLFAYDDVSQRIVIMGRRNGSLPAQTILIDPYSLFQETHVLNMPLIRYSLHLSPSRYFVKDSVLHWKVGNILKRFNMPKTREMEDLIFPKDHMDGVSCLAFNRKF